MIYAVRRGCLNSSRCAQATRILRSTSWHEGLFHIPHAGPVFQYDMYASAQMSVLCRGLVRSPSLMQMSVINAGKMERHARQSPRRRRRWHYEQRFRPQGRRSSAGSWAEQCNGVRVECAGLSIHPQIHPPTRSPIRPHIHIIIITHTRTCTYVHISVAYALTYTHMRIHIRC